MQGQVGLNKMLYLKQKNNEEQAVGFLIKQIPYGASGISKNIASCA